MSRANYSVYNILLITARISLYSSAMVKEESLKSCINLVIKNEIQTKVLVMWKSHVFEEKTEINQKRLEGTSGGHCDRV